jgi:hypothetical protein
MDKPSPLIHNYKRVIEEGQDFSRNIEAEQNAPPEGDSKLTEIRRDVRLTKGPFKKKSG